MSTSNALSILSGSPITRTFNQSVPTRVDLDASPAVRVPAEYIDGALSLCSVAKLKNRTWVATIPGFDGVWADGRTQQEAAQSLKSVLDGWLQLKVLDRDGDIPVINGINLNK